ncbi:MAG: hypothetical protein WAN35_16060 [Terracidiphilus sp.]
MDGFEAIKCSSNIPIELIGKRISNERVVVIERRHKDIGLKDLGGDEISDRLFLSSWLICGNEYLLLEDTHNHSSIIRDVLAFPPHSKIYPEFSGICQINNQEIPESVVGVLDDGAEHKAYSVKDKIFLDVKFAWKIDEINVKFVKIATVGLRCPKEDIITADGGH